MDLYTKLFNSILTSTVWGEDSPTRVVWITMLALVDKNGEVQASVPGLARFAGVTVNECENALHKFLSPDLHSRTATAEGRRIEKIDGGWSILNHAIYRERGSTQNKIEKDAERQQRHRSRNRDAGVTPRHANSTDTDTDADTEAEKKEYLVASATADVPLSPNTQEAFSLYCEMAKRKSWATPRSLDQARGKKLTAILSKHGIEGWQDMLKRASASEFMNSTFPLTFDWALVPANFRKIIEGNYPPPPKKAWN